MYTLEELLQYKCEVQNCKIALKNGRLMDCINFIDDSKWYSDDDKEYFAMAIIDDIDKERKDFPTAISSFNQSLRFIAQEIEEKLA